MQLPSSVPIKSRSAWEIQQAVVFALFMREMRARVGGRWLGLLWLVFEPLAHVMLVLALFTFVRNFARAGMEAPVFLVTGMLPFFIFRNVTLRVGDSVAANRGLFNYRQVNPADTMIARAAVELTLYSVVYLTLLAGLGWLGFQWLPVDPLELIGVSAILIALAFGLALVIAVTTLRRPKVRSVVGLLFVPLYLASGAIFPLHNLSAEVREWLLWNPVLHLIELSRYYFIPYYPRLGDVSIGYPAGCALVAISLGMALYRVERHRLRARD